MTLVLTFFLGVSLDYYNFLDAELGEPLYRMSVAIFIPLFVLLFTSQSITSVWFRFARWWLPLSVILILITPTSSNTWMPLYSVDKEMMTWIMGGLFTLISLILIARASLRSRVQAKK
jgi:hypothetical protein